MNWLQAINELKLPPLVSGAHSGGPEHGLCAMEMVAFMERLAHTDAPECTCKVITEFVICTNDILDDTQRQKLLPVLPELVDTVVNERHVRERQQLILNIARRDLEHANRGSYERDLHRDRGDPFRGFGQGHLRMEQIHHLLSTIGGSVKLMAQLHAPWHLADILIGVLHELLKIGATQPKTQFKEPELVMELAEVTYLSEHQLNEYKSKIKFMGTMPVVDKKFYSFTSDCMV